MRSGSNSARLISLSRGKNVLRYSFVVALFFIANIIVLLVTLHLYGDATEGWHQAVRNTVRFSSIPFLIGFTIGPIWRIWPQSSSLVVLTYRRAFGLSFAAAHLVHLYAVHNFLLNDGYLPKTPALVMDIVAVSFLLAMTLSSNDWAVRKLGTARWGQLHAIGACFIWLTLFVPFASRARFDTATLVYWVYTVLLAGAMALRIMGRKKADPGRSSSGA